MSARDPVPGSPAAATIARSGVSPGPATPGIPGVSSSSLGLLFPRIDDNTAVGPQGPGLYAHEKLKPCRDSKDSISSDAATAKHSSGDADDDHRDRNHLDKYSNNSKSNNNRSNNSSENNSSNGRKKCSPVQFNLDNLDEMTGTSKGKQSPPPFYLDDQSVGAMLSRQVLEQCTPRDPDDRSSTPPPPPGVGSQPSFQLRNPETLASNRAADARAMFVTPPHPQLTGKRARTQHQLIALHGGQPHSGHQQLAVSSTTLTSIAVSPLHILFGAVTLEHVGKLEDSSSSHSSGNNSNSSFDNLRQLMTFATTSSSKKNPGSDTKPPHPLKHEEPDAKAAVGGLNPSGTCSGTAAIFTSSTLTCVQTLSFHRGPVWAAKFSPSGEFLATGGEDGKLVVWFVGCDSFGHGCDDNNSDCIQLSTPNSPAVSASGASTPNDKSKKKYDRAGSYLLLDPKPYREFDCHTGDIVDISWSSAGSQQQAVAHATGQHHTKHLHATAQSKLQQASSSNSQHFILTACTDKCVRLFHVDKNVCLQTFRHPDIVTSVQFHPQSDKKFVSGCFDKRVRIWEIVPEPIIRQYCAVREIVSNTSAILLRFFR
jgi:hypothetical protein